MSHAPVAWIFSGQATEEPGMGRALFDGDREAAALLERASERVGIDLAQVLRRGGSAMERTEVVQPLLATIGLAAMRALQRAGARPDVTAGHSLGELVAYSAAGGMSAEVAVDVAAERGRLMEEIASRNQGGLLALTAMSGFDPARLGELEGVVAAEPALAMAAYNAPTEVVVSGTLPALEGLRGDFGGRIVQRLGPWHHPVMIEAVAPLHELLAASASPVLDATFVSNRDGLPLTDPATGPARLAEQLVHPVRWSACLRTLHDRGVRTFVAVGLERTLRGLVRLNGLHGVRVLPAVDPRSIARVAGE